MTTHTHCLSFDIEGFSESMEESFAVPARYLDPASRDDEIATNVKVILDLLEEHDTKATFFYLGRIALDQPELVRETAERGHEIACHSLYHRRIRDRTTFAADLRRAKSALEESSGTEVIGFRAPDFSITESTRWAFDVLADSGFRYDSSVVPTDVHDVYGIGSFPDRPTRLDSGLVEAPLSTVRIAGRALPACGGGYFRLYPLAVTRLCIQRLEAAGKSAMIYLHPYEVGPAYPRIRPLTLARRFRHYVAMDRGIDRLRDLLGRFRLVPVRDQLRGEGWL